MNIYPPLYYVYAYLRKSDNTPYYIGKGKGHRAWENHPGVSVPKDRSKIVFIERNLTNVGACAIERRLIAWYGRKDLGNGILLNRTPGGEGGRGGSQKGRIFSSQTRQRLSEAGRGRVVSESTRRKISESKTGKKRENFSAEWRANLSKNHRSKHGYVQTISAETRSKISKKLSKPIYCITTDKWYPSKKAAAAELGLKTGNIGHCLLGLQKTTKGYAFSYRKYAAQSS
jgi:hypothetical protein